MTKERKLKYKIKYFNEYGNAGFELAPCNKRKFHLISRQVPDAEKIQLSIEKWLTIAYYSMLGIHVKSCGGISTCPLCASYNVTLDGWCFPCPIASFGKEEDGSYPYQGCVGTPYEKMWETQNSNESFQVAKEEVRFLREVLKEEIGEE